MSIEFCWQLFIIYLTWSFRHFGTLIFAVWMFCIGFIYHCGIVNNFLLNFEYLLRDVRKQCLVLHLSNVLFYLVHWCLSLFFALKLKCYPQLTNAIIIQKYITFIRISWYVDQCFLSTPFVKRLVYIFHLFSSRVSFT